MKLYIRIRKKWWVLVKFVENFENIEYLDIYYMNVINYFWLLLFIVKCYVWEFEFL